MQEIDRVAKAKGYQSLSFETATPSVFHIFHNKLGYQIASEVIFEEIPYQMYYSATDYYL